MKIKTSELSGAALDWAVGNAEGEAGIDFCLKDDGSVFNVWTEDHGSYRPSEDWEVAGPLIQSNQIFLEPPHDAHRANYDEKTGKARGCWQTYESWHATVSARVRTIPPKIEGFPGRVGRGEGETALIAACRAIVTSVFGDEIEVPEELV